MPRKRKSSMEVREILRQLQDGQSARAVSRTLGLDRKTVARYRDWAQAHDLLKQPLPAQEKLHQLLNETLQIPPPPQNTSSVEPFGKVVQNLRRQGVEIAAIHQRLIERGFDGSYSAVYRYVRRLEPIKPNVTVRVETPPGEEAQVDFGFAGYMIDPETGTKRKTWVFSMVLSWSRHQFVEFVFDQKVETWLRLHRNAFAFFNGVPQRLIIDNLKAGVARVCWHEPEAQRSYRECAEHYGFLIRPCQPAKPEHKGKVEQGGIHYIKRNFLGGREVTDISQANQDVLRWTMTTAGQRIHGTTKEKPLVRFETEKAILRPLPGHPYDLAVWKQVKVHRDCYLVFEGSYYSVPFRLVEERLWVRGGVQSVQIYTDDYQLVATHTRAFRAGQRLTHPDHLPSYKLAGVMLTRQTCRLQAEQIGKATYQVVDVLLNHRPEDRLRTAGRLLKLAESYGSERLEAACNRALKHDDPTYMTIKRVLIQGLDAEPPQLLKAGPPARAFVRTAAELMGNLMGGATWK